ncbi:hypothetical protein ICN48_05250 [Polynucleobacter sp. JS-Safj-400b-B2]|uniref:hypothetical protein n=1 Tax=Polynucleobacter sp. JS-Safj-400b-B2 TaxID=2576921 RepID=UPI001C0C299C|nr:hypothetical protein [Polynucleobacter sp. JS-Safj-400b-B2]MBU3625641.1 hypothetical protein [Polynucleobacter sp. JS-Safj-400b-B2]
MRRICIALCFSLFASLIHAAVMPIDLSVEQAQHQVTVADNSAHHCDEVVSNSHDTNTNQPCHGDSYQCCLGLVVIPILSIELSIASTQAPPSTGSLLVLQPMINFIYKPPKV